MRVYLDNPRDFERFAYTLRTKGSPALRRAVSRSFRRTAKPTAEQILRAGATKLPKRGGLSARVATTPPALRFSIATQSPYASINFGGRKGLDFRSLDEGLVRHPVFARPNKTRKEWTWVAQRIPAHAFTDELPKHKDQVVSDVVREVQSTLDDLARKAKK